MIVAVLKVRLQIPECVMNKSELSITDENTGATSDCLSELQASPKVCVSGVQGWISAH